MTDPVPTPAEVVDAMHAAFRLSDLDGIARYWAEDVSYRAPGVELSGKAARVVAETVWLNAFSDNEVETTRRFVDGDEIVDFAIMSGLHSGPLALPGGQTLAPTGVRVSGPYVARYRIVDGRVVDQHVIYDRLTLVEQLQGGAS
ncbi:ester cyclase [Phenylobacterium sp.]|uniref:ester cyclase n=1 Tax=Phenylobacterium sp. TaxID=1871053 RepID=UPI0035AF0EAC